MNTRLRLTVLAAVFAFLTPATSTLHGQVLAPTGGIDVPDGTRKCIKPQERAPKPTDLLVPLVCVEPVVNVSATAGNQAESFVNVNPTNTNNLVATSNNPGTVSIFRAYSTDAGATWTRGTIATGVACCDGQAAWDSFGNLFLVYINNSVNQINVILSTDGGVTFSAPVTAGTGNIDQPSIAVGNGSVWVDWNQNGSMVARGAPVTGLGYLGTLQRAAGDPLSDWQLRGHRRRAWPERRQGHRDLSEPNWWAGSGDDLRQCRRGRFGTGWFRRPHHRYGDQCGRVRLHPGAERTLGRR